MAALRPVAGWRRLQDVPGDPLPRRRGLAPEHIAPVVDAVAEAQDEFQALSADGSADDPAKEILTRVLAEGVDLHDRDAVDQVIGAYNAEQNARRLLEP